MKDHLAASSAFARLAGQAERLRHLQTLLESSLPAHLALAARVANLKRGKVVIHADSGAVAVKLRQLSPRLSAGFIQQGQEVNGIEVKVQPSSRSLPKSSKIAHKTLGVRTKQSLTSLIAGLAPESPVRGALERLLKNA